MSAQVADKLLGVEPGRFRVIDGNYDTYQHLVRQGLAKEARAGTAVATVKDKEAGEKENRGKQAKERRKRKFPYRKTAEIEAEIAEREERIEEIHQLFSQEDVLRDGGKVKQLKTELDEHELALPRLYEHWEEASEIN